MANPENMLSVIDDLIAALPRLVEVQQIARKLIDEYPSSVGARVLSEMLALCDEAEIGRPGFTQHLEREAGAAEKRHLTIDLQRY